MCPQTPARDQQIAARVVGALYLATMATAITAQLLSDPMIVVGDAVQTAANITGSTTRFRLSILCDFLTSLGVFGLVAALYVVLKPISRGLALFGLVTRLAETTILIVALLRFFSVLSLLGGSSYLGPVSRGVLEAFAYMAIREHSAATQIGFSLLGTGSAVFAYLWFKSRYIPRVIAIWGLLASSLMAVVSMATVIWPNLPQRVGILYMLPLGLFEIGLGLWLLFRGLAENQDLAPSNRSATVWRPFAS